MRVPCASASDSTAPGVICVQDAGQLRRANIPMQEFCSESGIFAACSVTVQLTAASAEDVFCSMLQLASGSKCKSCYID
jgi:hypothetical protein